MLEEIYEHNLNVVYMLKCCFKKKDVNTTSKLLASKNVVSKKYTKLNVMGKKKCCVQNNKM